MQDRGGLVRQARWGVGLIRLAYTVLFITALSFLVCLFLFVCLFVCFFYCEGQECIERCT